LQDICKAGLVFVAKVFASNLEGDMKMRYLRLSFAITMLVCAFAFPTYAGGIECDVITPQPPQPTATATATGNIECDLTEIAVSLIQGALSLS
jgi:hypothetical protein